MGNIFNKALSKDVRSQGVCPVQTFFGWGQFRWGRLHFSCKNLNFFEIYGVPARTKSSGI